MRQSFYLGASQLSLLILALICPKTVTTYPQSSTVDQHELESTLNNLQAALQNPRDPKPLWPQDLLQALLGSEEEEDLKPWAEETLLRAQRGDSLDLPLAPFTRENSLEDMHFQEGGEGEEGRKRNDALTSIAGGLQAVSREKGGFGFRFGKKRWTEKNQKWPKGPK